MPIKIDIPFNGPSYKSDSLIISPQECINFYLRPYPELGEEKYALFGTPGLELFHDPGTAEEVRASIQQGGYYYMVVGSEFRRVTAGGASAVMGSLRSSLGMVGIATNGLDITMVDGRNGYVYDLDTEDFTWIADANFPGGDNIVQIDGYYLVNKPRTGQVYRSDWNNGLSWGGLAFDTAGGDPDNIVSLLVDYPDLWTIGEKTMVPWYNSGASTFNFNRITGAFIKQGSSSSFARAAANNAIYWLSRDKDGQGQVFQAVGRRPQVISAQIADELSGYSTLSDAFMFSYQQKGHTHIVLTFPTENKTHVYDSTTGFWHERSSLISGKASRWRVNCHSMFDGNHIVGDYTNGMIYKLKTDVYDENGDDMVATRTSPIIRKLQERITIDEVQIVTEPAVGLSTGNAEDIDPRGMFSWTRNGRIWSAEINVSLGKIGEYGNRTIATQLGQGINWAFRLRVSAAVKRVVLGAVALGEVDD